MMYLASFDVKTTYSSSWPVIKTVQRLVVANSVEEATAKLRRVFEKDNGAGERSVICDISITEPIE